MGIKIETLLGREGPQIGNSRRGNWGQISGRRKTLGLLLREGFHEGTGDGVPCLQKKMQCERIGGNLFATGHVKVFVHLIARHRVLRTEVCQESVFEGIKFLG